MPHGSAVRYNNQTIYRAIMITNHIMYGVKCSRCGHQFEDSYNGYTAWADEQQAWEAAEEEDWIERDGKHYCPACYEEDEESGDMVPKSPYPQAFRDFRHRMSSILPNLELQEDSQRQVMHCSYTLNSKQDAIQSHPSRKNKFGRFKNK